jgi:hypothetical protein
METVQNAEPVYFFSAEATSAAGSAAGVGAAATAAAAGVGAGAAGCSAFGSVLKSKSSPIGPLVALMPGAGLDVGITGGSSGAAGVGAGAVSVGFASTALGSDAVDAAGSWEAAAVGGAGAVAPAGSGPRKGND